MVKDGFVSFNSNLFDIALNQNIGCSTDYTTFLNAHMIEPLHYFLKQSFFSHKREKQIPVPWLLFKGSYILKNNNDFQRKFFEDGFLKMLDFLTADIVVGFEEFTSHLTVTTSWTDCASLLAELFVNSWRITIQLL